ncbi:uncharacterized protein LOC143473722 [Brachyhypopomus gauderio]|uniref:uncharacterized protein LOC143473722 n=1 Tax=Brachyhypopomus gauderio TaxID=698409 RepID=UPI0040421EC7
MLERHFGQLTTLTNVWIKQFNRESCLERTDNYLTARQALKKSLNCSTSDIQSEEEVDSRPLRKPKRIHYLGESDEDSDESDLRVPLKKQRAHQPAPSQAPQIPPPSALAPVLPTEILAPRSCKDRNWTHSMHWSCTEM